MECQQIIVDCDTGSDDAFALAMLLAAHNLKKIKMLGITCVAGNTSVENVVKNVFRTLDVCNAKDVSVIHNL